MKLIYLLSCIFRFFFVWRFVNLFVKSSYKERFRCLLLFFIFCCVDSFVSLMISSCLFNILIIPVETFVLLILLRIKDIYCIIFSVFINFFLEISIYIIMLFYMRSPEYFYIIYIITGFVVLLLELIIKYFYRGIPENDFKIYSIGFLLLLIDIYLFINTFFDIHIIFNMLFFQVLCVFVLHIYNEILCLKSNEKKGFIYKEQLKALRQEIYRILHIKHDMKLCIFNMKELIRNENYIELERYINYLEKDIKGQDYIFSKKEQLKRLINYYEDLFSYNNTIVYKIHISEDTDIYGYSLDIAIKTILSLVYRYSKEKREAFVVIEERFSVIFIKVSFIYEPVYISDIKRYIADFEQRLKKNNNYSILKFSADRLEFDIILYKNNISNLY